MELKDFPSFGLFPPFYTDCGKNPHFGNNVFVNSGCRFQDQGGIWIGDKCKRLTRDTKFHAQQKQIEE